MYEGRRFLGQRRGFATYFRALWGSEPFPWQVMLAERVTTGEWPRALDLPTASGKTACIDIAICALAAQAHRPLAERTAPRRIWFVVDRRIVVDEAFKRAQKIATALAGATGGSLEEVANRLRELSGTERPLAVGRLRGGILRDDGWARIPSQPAVITCTVDQVGSRLVFRGYGHSLLPAPIFARLAANDSLIVLDEAHCSVAFMQTLEAIGRYRGREWAEELLPRRLSCRGAGDLPQVRGRRMVEHPADQLLLQDVGRLVERVDSQLIRDALFQPWSYRDERLSLRWDPVEDHRYALSNQDPSEEPTRTVWMANLLAYRALTLYPTAPRGRSRQTAGWNGEAKRRQLSFTWPLWESPVGRDVVRSLVQLRELLDERLDVPTLRLRAIIAAYRSQRIEVGKGVSRKLNFSPARRVA